MIRVPKGRIAVKHDDGEALAFVTQQQLDTVYADKGWHEASDEDIEAESERLAGLSPKKQAQAIVKAAHAAPLVGPGPKQQAAIARQAERDAQAAAASDTRE